jgi:hypothetical protein
MAFLFFTSGGLLGRPWPMALRSLRGLQKPKAFERSNQAALHRMTALDARRVLRLCTEHSRPVERLRESELGRREIERRPSILDREGRNHDDEASNVAQVASSVFGERNGWSSN